MTHPPLPSTKQTGGFGAIWPTSGKFTGQRLKPKPGEMLLFTSERSRLVFSASLQTLAGCEEQSEVKPLQNRWLKSAQLKRVNTFFILPGTLSSICVLQKAQSDRRVKPRMSSASVNTLLLRVNLCLYFLYTGPYVHRRQKPRTEMV